MKRVAALLAIIALAAPVSGAAALTEHWRPNKAQVARLEARLVMPFDAAPLDQYRRYYTGAHPKRAHRVAGLLYRDFDDPPGVIIVDKPDAFPMIFDGGCDVIHVTYDLATDEVLELFCNGVA